MIGLLVGFFVLYVILAVLIGNAGVALGLMIGGSIVALVVRYGTRTTKTGVLFKEICPECRKHVKPKARRCQWCGTTLEKDLA